MTLVYTFCLTLAIVHAAPLPDDDTLSNDVTHQPNDDTHQSGNGVRRPDNGVQRPDTGDQPPDSRSQRPDTGGQQPDTGDQPPDSGGQRPDTGGQRPNTGDQTPDNGGQRPDNETRHLQLKALEQVKDELYQQLQGAVSDAVQELNRSGDAAALQQIRELQQRLNDAAPQRDGSAPARRQFDQYMPDENATPDGPTRDDPAPDVPAPDARPPPALGPMMLPPTPTADKSKDRRAQGTKDAKYWYDFFNMDDALKLHFDDQGFLPSKINKKKEVQKSKQDINKKFVVERLKQWIMQKQEEKRKIREWRTQFATHTELCPRWGRNRGKLYPCCRKCCKGSYLGCL